MTKKLTTEQATILVRFVAHLAWADDFVNTKEIDHVLQLRKKLRLPDELDAELMTILSTKKSNRDIYFAYSDLKRQFHGSRKEEEVSSTSSPSDEVDRLISAAIFDLLKSDGEISSEEGEMVSWLKNLETDVESVKKKIFTLFSWSGDHRDEGEAGAPVLV